MFLGVSLFLLIFLLGVPRGTLPRDIRSTWNKLALRGPQGMFHVEHILLFSLGLAFVSFFIGAGVLLSFSKTAIGALFFVCGYWMLRSVCSTWNNEGRGWRRRLFHVEQEKRVKKQDVPRGTFVTRKRAGLCSTWNIVATLCLFILAGGFLLAWFGLDLHTSLEQTILERKMQYLSILDIPLYQWMLGLGFSGYITQLMLLHPDYSLWQYQPIHNFWLMGLLELGVLPVLILIILFQKKLQKLASLLFTLPGWLRGWWGSFAFFLLACSMADHYFWDIEQAQFLLVVSGMFLIFALNQFGFSRGEKL
jgi:hypothetical protein